MYTQDTIAAIATPPGTGGVGIIRISGSQAFALACSLFRSKKLNKFPSPGRMYFGDYVDKDDNLVDSGYFVWFKSPRSFTGEDVVEYHCHGGMIILQAMLRSLFSLGVRPADPGEFSKRAFLNGQIDLVQAESISDLISADSTRAADIARTHYRGQLSEKIESIREQLVAIMAWMEAEIDYPEARIDSFGRDKAVTILMEQVLLLNQLENTYHEGKIYREGITTVILGKPNVGKSSLLNSLSGEDRAIVTDIPGTTRDVLEVPVNIRGIPLRLADTAGIRESLDKIEKIGIERAQKLAAQADLTLLLIDTANPLTGEDLLLLDTVNKGNTIIILNKIDLPACINMRDISDRGFKYIQQISVLKEQGFEELKDAIENMFVTGQFDQDTTFITNQRHYRALERAAQLVECVATGWDDLPLDILALDLREGWQALGEITGAVWTDDLLDCIFQRFCLGK